MSRLTEMWFTFRGVLCEDVGVRLAHAPTREIPVLRGRRETVAGRSGSLWIPEGDEVYEDVGVVAECYTLPGASIDRAAAWLTGGGELIFSDEPDRAYRARIADQISRSSLMTMFSMQRFPITFSCQPYRYLYPPADPIALTAAGTVMNPGTAKSTPRITIEGTGDLSVYIGGQMIAVTGGSVIVDSEKNDCFDADGVTLANGRVTMEEFPEMAPGANAVSWTGDVKSVMIEGRWRYL